MRSLVITLALLASCATARVHYSQFYRVIVVNNSQYPAIVTAGSLNGLAQLGVVQAAMTRVFDIPDEVLSDAGCVKFDARDFHGRRFETNICGFEFGTTVTLTITGIKHDAI